MKILLLLLPIFIVYGQNKIQTDSLFPAFTTSGKLLHYNFAATKHLPANYIDFLIHSQNKKKQSQIIEIDSLIVYCEPPFASQKLKFTYDYSGRIAFYLRYLNNQGDWDLSFKTTYSYDSVGNKILELTEYLSNQWLPLYKYIFEYDARGYKTLEAFWDYEDSIWLNHNYYKYLYYENKVLTEFWDWDGLKWINTSQTSHFYVNGLMDSILIKGNRNGQWIDEIAAKAHYDKKDNLVFILWRKWNEISWENYLTGKFDNDVYGNIIMGTTELWDGNNWNNYARYIKKYNSLKYITEANNQNWENGVWVAGNGLLDFTNPDGFGLGFIATQISVYNKITSIKEDPSTFDGYYLNQNYPNPFNPSTTIEFTIPQEGVVELKIFNILGQEIKTLINEVLVKGTHYIQFNANNLASGFYVYRLKHEYYNKSKIMILQK